MQIKPEIMNNNAKIGLALIAGIAAGVIAGILMAPDKGSETRKKIAGKAKEFGDLVKGKANEFGEVMKDKANDGFKFAGNFKERIAKEYVD